MLLSPRHLLVCIAYCNIVVAINHRTGSYCYDSCQYTLRTVQFNDAPPGTPKTGRLCHTSLGAASLLLCLKIYCNAESSAYRLHQYNETCQALHSSLPPLSIVSNYSDEDVARVRKLQRDEALRATPANEIVIPSNRLFQLTFDTITIAQYEYLAHKRYGWAMYYFWIAVMSISLAARFTSLAGSCSSAEWLPSSLVDGTEPEPHTPKRQVRLRDRLHAYLRSHIVLPATFGYRCAQKVGWCTVPPRIQSLTILVFVLMNLMFCCYDYTVFPDNMYWPEVRSQLLRYISDRTGIISFANFPIIWLFAMRNNLVELLTGWSFATCTNFHRWVARVSTVQAVVHSVGYTIMVMESGGWQHFMFYWTKRYWYMGEIATIFMCFILASSFYGLRRSYYEVFLFLHIYLSLVALITMWYHVEIFNGEYDVFFWPCAVLWIGDRALRIFRILILNPRFWERSATISYSAKSNIIRVVVPHRSKTLEPYPGSFYYVYTLNHLRFWESHPFTLAYSTSSDQICQLSSKSLQRPEGRFDENNRSSSQSLGESSDSECEGLLTPTKGSSSSLVFLIRPYDGFTSRLKDHCTTSPRPLRVLLEGPYGKADPLHAFANIVFVGGGSGIAVPLSFLRSLASSDSRVQSVSILWAVREPSFFLDLVTKDINLALSPSITRVSLSAYFTRWDTSSAQNAPSYQRATHLLDIKLFNGRPNIHDEVEKAAIDGAREREKLAVVACGPGQMLDITRATVVELVRKGYSDVEFFEKSFNW